MVSAKLAMLVRLMETVICDVEVALYNEISMSLLRISREHPEEIVEYVYDPSRDIRWEVSVGLHTYRDEHLESCLGSAAAYAGLVAIPARHVQVHGGKFVWNKTFKRPGQTRDEPAREESLEALRKGRDVSDQ